MFGSKREEVEGSRRRLHNEDLHNLYVSSYIIRVIKSKRIWKGHGARMGEIRNAYEILVGKPEGKRPFGKTRRRLEDKIRRNLRETVWEIVDWAGLSGGLILAW